MPTYQYSCTDCGHFFEVFQSFSDDSLTVCPECGGTLRKVFNAVGVVFKGSGFYRTDSRGASSATTTTTEKGSSSGDAAASTAKSDSSGASSTSASTSSSSTSGDAKSA